MRNYWHLAVLVLIVLLSLLVRLYFLDFNVEVDVSDEGEYLIMAESFAKGEIVFQWPYYRPFLIPMFWGLLIRLGFGLDTIRFSILMFSLLSNLLVYLIGRDLFNRKVGLLAAFFFVFFPDEILHSTRVLLNVPALAMWLLSIYLFQRAYFKKSNALLYFCGLISGLAVLVYNQNLVLIGFYFLFLLVAGGLDFIRQFKYICFFLIIIFIYSLSFLYSHIWFGNLFINFGYGLWLSFIDSSSRNYFVVILDFILYLPKYISWFYLPLFILVLLLMLNNIFRIFGLIRLKMLLRPLLYTLIMTFIFFVIKTLLSPRNFLAIELKVIFYLISTVATILFLLLAIYFFRGVFKNIAVSLTNETRKNLFLVLWLFVSLFVVVGMVGYFQARYFIPVLIPFFLYFGLIGMKLYSKSVKCKKFMWLLFIFLFLVVLGAYTNLKYTSGLVYGYASEQSSSEIGEWLKNNTEHGDVIFGPLNYALAYYSERQWYKYPVSRTFDGRSYSGFLEKLNKLRPKFLVVYYSDRYISENEIYLRFISENKDNLTLVYSYLNNNGRLVEVYKIKIYK